MVGGGEAVDPLRGGGEQDAVPGLAGPDRRADRQMGLAGSGRAEEHHVVFGGDEVQGAQVGDQVTFESAGVVEVELLQRLSCREPGGPDAAFTAVGFAGGDFALQTRRQELLVRPGLGAGPLGQPGHRFAQGRRLQARVRTPARRSRRGWRCVVLVAITPPARRGRAAAS